MSAMERFLAAATGQERWAGLSLGDPRPAVRFNGEEMPPTIMAASERGAAWDCDAWRIRMEFVPQDPQGVELRTSFRAEADGVLNHVELLTGTDCVFGVDPEQVCVMTLSRYGGDVVPLARAAAPRALAGGEPNETAPVPAPSTLTSENVMVVYDRVSRHALLIGFLAGERWQGRVALEVAPDGVVRRLAVGFDGGDLPVRAQEQLELEPIVLMAGTDPWRLLERYGDLAKARHAVACTARPPVSWCSWYPYRLGVSEERLLAEARIAAQRLKPLGLSIVEADLGWERQHLPHVFEPNERFPHGLQWLTEQLGQRGLNLGVWKAPFTISALDALAKEHPEWMIQGADGQPVSVWTWFWEPHGDVYILDLTHPGAQAWLRANLEALHAAGIRYFKADFIGMAADPRAKRRHDPRVVAGGGTEAARLGAQIIREALPDAWILNCGGPQIPGTGAWPLLYVCNDTGNTGLQSWTFARENFRAAACHLWQNGRWGIIQTSCLCVGLPGSLEEARVRATVAFMSGGQIDISDALTTLPEDRWAVLEATLPPLGQSATPIDLFDPVFHRRAADYEALCKGLPTAYEERKHPPGSVWHMRVQRDWDQWDLLAGFAFEHGPGHERPELTNFTIPLERLGLAADGSYWACEFWSGQFLGAVPGGRTNAGGYAHPGDWQDLVVPAPPGCLGISFTGPGVKLIALRKVRTHPWVVGTSFHQSGGAELADVRWDPEARTLSGVLNRPAGHTGQIVVALPPHWAAGAAWSDTQSLPVRPTAASGCSLAVTTTKDVTSWRMAFSKR